MNTLIKALSELANARDARNEAVEAVSIKYIASTVQIDESNDIQFEAHVIANGQNAVHCGLTISADLLNLLCSDDSAVQREMLAMLRALHMQQVIGQFYDDEADNLKHCIAPL